jgi:cbb3-type cytochrome oxidase maturation protein
MMLTGLILLSLALGLAAWLGFVWSVKSGQYDDPEGPKYRMLDDEEEERPGSPRPPEAPSRPPEPPRG